MDQKIGMTLLTGAALLLVGAFFIENNPWFSYTESAILYLAAVVGAGCFWIGLNCGEK